MTALLDSLLASITAACNARGDDDANRAALLAEAEHLTPAAQLDMVEHFDEQARLYGAKT